MIHVVELASGRLPSAWFAHDDADFARKVSAGDTLQPWEIHDVLTPRDLLEAAGHAQDDAGARAALPATCALGDAHGWDTPLFRADYLLGRGVLQAEPVQERDAFAAALLARGAACCIYWNDTEAVAAFEGCDPRLAGEANWSARRALYEQLVALEVLADNH